MLTEQNAPCQVINDDQDNLLQDNGIYFTTTFSGIVPWNIQYRKI